MALVRGTLQLLSLSQQAFALHVWLTSAARDRPRLGWMKLNVY